MEGKSRAKVVRLEVTYRRVNASAQLGHALVRGRHVETRTQEDVKEGPKIATLLLQVLRSQFADPPPHLAPGSRTAGQLIPIGFKPVCL